MAMGQNMDRNLPEHASVVVIGGGIMGCSTLYHLAQMGVSDAVLLERNALTSGTTWHSAAQVRALRHSQNLTRMIQYSVDLYSRLEQETGPECWLDPEGQPVYCHHSRPSNPCETTGSSGPCLWDRGDVDQRS